MAVDVNKVFDKFPKGVFIISSKGRLKENALTASWVSRVSWQPPMIMVSLAKKRLTHEMVKKSKVFAVNIISKKQLELARYFGSVSGRREDKFKKVAFEIKKTGSPILRDALAYFDCKVVKQVPAGDHTIFIGKVVDAAIQGKGKPLHFKKEDFF